jgi:hypothetical protein
MASLVRTKVPVTITSLLFSILTERHGGSLNCPAPPRPSYIFAIFLR